LPRMLANESPAIDFVRDAFAHLKAIGVDSGGQSFLANAHVASDAGIISISDTVYRRRQDTAMGPRTLGPNLGVNHIRSRTGWGCPMSPAPNVACRKCDVGTPNQTDPHDTVNVRIASGTNRSVI